MLTIFSTPKPFTGDIRTQQTNAIKSWAALKPSCDIILFGDEDGTAEICAKLGIKQIAAVERNEYGTPLISSMFKIAQEMAGNELVCYVNADIILMSDFMQAIRQVQIKPFLMVGQRRDIDLNETLDFQKADWEAKLKIRVDNEGRLHGVTGIDYFVFPKGLYDNMPPLAVGRPGWDNWLIYHTRLRKIPVIDATAMITVVHQNHGHANYSGGEKGFWEGPEAKRNIELAGGRDHVFHIGFADWTFTTQGLHRARGWQSFYFRLRALPLVHPRLRFLLPLVKLPGQLVGALRRT